MEEKKLFIKEVMPGIFLMDEAHEATGYLVIGNERACVIDTMNGYNDLYQAVRELTRKPLTVVNTHGHPDHIFGNMFFQEAYLHPADRELARMFIEDREYRKMLEARKKHSRLLRTFFPVTRSIWEAGRWKYSAFRAIHPEGSCFCFGKTGSCSPVTV